MRRPLALLVLIAVTGLAGCGQGGTKNSDSTKDFTGDQQKVAATIEDLQTAAKDQKGVKICSDLITAELRDKISQTDCGAKVKDAIRETDEADLTVKKVTVTGNKAVAQVDEKIGDKKQRSRTVELEKAAGAWRISALPSG